MRFGYYSNRQEYVEEKDLYKNKKEYGHALEKEKTDFTKNYVLK